MGTCGVHLASSIYRPRHRGLLGLNRFEELLHKDLKTAEPALALPGPTGEGPITEGRGLPQSFLPPGAGLLVRTFPELKGVSVDTVGDSSFTLSSRVFLRAAGETFSWSAMDCSSLETAPKGGGGGEALNPGARPSQGFPTHILVTPHPC